VSEATFRRWRSRSARSWWEFGALTVGTRPRAAGSAAARSASAPSAPRGHRSGRPSCRPTAPAIQIFCGPTVLAASSGTARSGRRRRRGRRACRRGELVVAAVEQVLPPRTARARPRRSRCPMPPASAGRQLKYVWSISPASPTGVTFTPTTPPPRRSPRRASPAPASYDFTVTVIDGAMLAGQQDRARHDELRTSPPSGDASVATVKPQQTRCSRDRARPVPAAMRCPARSPWVSFRRRHRRRSAASSPARRWAARSRCAHRGRQDGDRRGHHRERRHPLVITAPSASRPRSPRAPPRVRVVADDDR